jgi:hypothetical protein
MTTVERVEEVLATKGTEDIVEIHNEYCRAINSMDDWIYSMDEIDEILYGEEPHRILLMQFNGHEFNPNDDYFYFNGYGNLESFNNFEDWNSNVYISDIARYIVSSGNDFGCYDIEEALEADEEEEE